MSEEQAIILNDVIPEDFEMLVHYYDDFRSVALPNCSLYVSLSELTR